MTREDFHEAYFYQMLFDTRDIFTEFLKDSQDYFKKLAIEELSSYLAEIEQGQKEEKIPKLESIQISLLRTSFFEEKLCFQMDAYDKQGSLIGKNYLCRQIETISMESTLKKICDTWIEWTKEQHVEKVISEAYIESLLLSMMTPVFRYFISVYRYSFYELFAQSNVHQLQLSEDFYVNLGQLEGFQKMIYALRPDRDLLIQDKSALWNFTHYEKKVYQNEAFDGLTITWGIFRNCTFEHCEIKNFSWTDCEFHHCTFHDVHFSDGAFYGSQWKQCVILKCNFVSVDFYQTEENRLESMERYRETGMSLSHMNGCMFYMCRLEETKLEQCSVTNTELRICGMASSDFESLSGV